MHYTSCYVDGKVRENQIIVCILKYPNRISKKMEAMHIAHLSLRNLDFVLTHVHVQQHSHLQYVWVNYRNAYRFNCLHSVCMFVCINAHVEKLFESTVLWIPNAMLWNSIQLGIQSHRKGGGRGQENMQPTKFYLINLDARHRFLWLTSQPLELDKWFETQWSSAMHRPSVVDISNPLPYHFSCLPSHHTLRERERETDSIIYTLSFELIRLTHSRSN